MLGGGEFCRQSQGKIPAQASAGVHPIVASCRAPGSKPVSLLETVITLKQDLAAVPIKTGLGIALLHSTALWLKGSN